MIESLSQRNFWNFFVLGFAIVFVCVAGPAAFQVLQYLRLSSHAPAAIQQWEMVEVGRDAFTLSAAYSFLINGDAISGSDQLRNLRVRSRGGAEAAKTRAAAAEWTVWYSPRNPGFNRLEHTFPWKPCIYSGIVFFSLCYVLAMTRLIRRGTR
jgi:hypothetical protein